MDAHQWFDTGIDGPAQHRWFGTAVVGAGSPANGPGLRANFHPPFTVAAATVFAGKPAPTWTGGGRASVVRHRHRRPGTASVVRHSRCRSGFTREWAGPAGQFSPAVHRCCCYRIRG
ncbi:hypothetical protein PRJ_3770 [Pseudomonas sp. XWY-1]|nr:hypothetical protein PRJ_3770 [Pseudomonas sp. XWY-1]